MDKILLITDTALYLVIISIVIYKILGYTFTNPFYIIIDICLLVALSIAVFSIEDDIFTIMCLLIHIVQIILIFFAARGLRLITVIGLYSFLYSINSIIIVAISCFIPLSITMMTIVEFVFHIILSLCIVLCSFNRKICNQIKQVLFYVPTKIKLLSISSIFASAIFLVLILSTPEMYINSPWSIAIRIALIFFALFMCTTFPVLIITVLTNTYLKKQNESFERELEAQAEHYVSLAESNKELRRFKHDFKNLRIGIAKALTSGDCEIALEMIENGQNDFIQATDNIVKYNTGNGIVNAILSEKQKKASAANTIITFEGMLPQTGFSPTDLCVIFGNTLDNAIEACEKICDGKNKIIAVSVNCTNGFIFITITNPVLEKVIVHNNHIETTKKDRTSHGFGLYSLQKIAKKYNGEMSLTSEDHIFTLALELCL